MATIQDSKKSAAGEKSLGPLYRQIAERLKEYIIERNLQPGDKLPTEHELTQMFDASRSSIREATRFLQAAGVIRVRKRGGAVVREPEVGDLMNQMAYSLQLTSGHKADLWEVRLVLETGVLPLVVARATSKDIEELDQIIDAMDKAVFAENLYRQLDLRFHRMLLRIAGNRMVSEFGRVIDDFFAHPEGSQPTPTQRREFNQEHRRLRDCIADGDWRGAQEVLQPHLWRYHKKWSEKPPVILEEKKDE